MKFKTESKSNEIQFIPLSETLVALLPHFDTFAHDWSLYIYIYMYMYMYIYIYIDIDIEYISIYMYI